MAFRTSVALLAILSIMSSSVGAITFSDLCKALPWSEPSVTDQAVQVLTGERKVVLETDFETGEKVLNSSCTQSEVIQVLVILLAIAVLFCCTCISCCSSNNRSSRRHVIQVPQNEFVGISMK